MMERYSADAVRYWAASTGLGRDALVSEDKIASGNRLVTKLWNVARFAQPFLEGYDGRRGMETRLRWMWARFPYRGPRPNCGRPTAGCWMLCNGPLAGRRSGGTTTTIVGRGRRRKGFFWNILADNYLEMAKARLYERPDGDPGKESARYALYYALLSVCKLLAPILPHITEEIFQSLGWVQPGQRHSIHRAAWPQPDEAMLWPEAGRVGAALVGIATAVRRAKTAQHLRLGAPVGGLAIACEDAGLINLLQGCTADLQSVSRAAEIIFDARPAPGAMAIEGLAGLWVAVDTEHESTGV